MVDDRTPELPEPVREVLRLAEELGEHGTRRRLGALLETPLTVQQLRVLTAVVLEGAVAPAQVSAMLHVTPATVTGIADRLERAGMITRGTDERDHRARTLRPTPAGRAVVRTLLAADLDADADLLLGLTPEELSGLALGFAAMLRQVHAAPPGGDPGRMAP
jgi:DNA-binding MarR family transcriptional regulator